MEGGGTERVGEEREGYYCLAGRTILYWQRGSEWISAVQVEPPECDPSPRDISTGISFITIHYRRSTPLLFSRLQSARSRSCLAGMIYAAYSREEGEEGERWASLTQNILHLR